MGLHRATRDRQGVAKDRAMKIHIAILAACASMFALAQAGLAQANPIPGVDIIVKKDCHPIRPGCKGGIAKTSKPSTPRMVHPVVKPGKSQGDGRHQ